MRTRKTRRQSRFTKPRWLYMLIILLGVAAVISAFLAFRSQTEAASAIGSVALIITLLVVILYTHFTALYAKASAYPPVSFDMRSPKPGYFQFWIMNHSNVPVSCWCKLNPTYEKSHLRFGSHNSLGGFYEGESSFDVLPYQTVHGASFDLSVFFMGKDNDAWDDIVKRAKGGGFPRLRFGIQFWYEARELGFHSQMVEQRYYYDFGIDKMILDY